MTIDKIRELLILYEKKLKEEFNCEPRRANHLKSYDFDEEAQLEHCYWMIVNIALFLSEEKKEKAMRWLGFIQGVLWTNGIYKIHELKDHNKP